MGPRSVGQTSRCGGRRRGRTVVRAGAQREGGREGGRGGGCRQRHREGERRSTTAGGGRRRREEVGSERAWSVERGAGVWRGVGRGGRGSGRMKQAATAGTGMPGCRRAHTSLGARVGGAAAFATTGLASCHACLAANTIVLNGLTSKRVLLFPAPAARDSRPRRPAPTQPARLRFSGGGRARRLAHPNAVGER